MEDKTAALDTPPQSRVSNLPDFPPLYLLHLLPPPLLPLPHLSHRSRGAYSGWCGVAELQIAPCSSTPPAQLITGSLAARPAPACLPSNRPDLLQHCFRTLKFESINFRQFLHSSILNRINRCPECAKLSQVSSTDCTLRGSLGQASQPQPSPRNPLWRANQGVRGPGGYY